MPRERRGEEEEEQDVTEVAIKNAPPWLVSAVVHAILVIILAFWVLSMGGENTVSIDGEWAKEEGEQLEDDSFTNDVEEPEDFEDVVITEMQTVTDPFAAPTMLDAPVVDVGTTAVSNIKAPAIGMALNGREPGMKKALLGKYGGSPGSEKAVQMGLEWLQKVQDKHTGGWSLSKGYPDGSDRENSPAATAMALLAFQGAGHTHKKPGPFQNTVAKGWEYLLKLQQPDGDFYDGEAPYTHHLYTHGQCSIAVCELYGMTKDPKFKQPAEKAIEFCISSQHRLGGWRYSPQGDSDTSVSGWIVMALQSARMAGLQVPPTTLDQVGRYLDKAGSAGGSQYGYQNDTSSTETMTAEGLLMRQYLGWKQDDPRLLQGADFLLAGHLPNWGDRNVYYWYYATQVMHHLEGHRWEKWNSVMRDLLVNNQVKSGGDAGSWHPHKPQDKWGYEGGRLYVTCLSIYIL